MTMFQKILATAGAVILAVILFGREKAWEGLQTVWQYFTSGAMIPVLAIGLVAGCAAGGGLGPQTAPFFEIDTMWFNGRGMPTAVPENSTAAGFRDGNGVEDIYSWMKSSRLEATGWASRIGVLGELSVDAQRLIAQLYLCEVARNAVGCGAGAPQEQQATLLSELQ